MQELDEKIKKVYDYKEKLDNYNFEIVSKFKDMTVNKSEIITMRDKHNAFYNEYEAINETLCELAETSNEDESFSELSEQLLSTLLSCQSKIDYYDEKIRNPNKWIIHLGKAGAGKKNLNKIF